MVLPQVSKSENLQEVGRKIRHYREKKKMSQLELAEAIGVTQNTIYLIETAQSEMKLEKLFLMLPEFLGQMVECLDCESVGWKYIKNSQYYCYEYKLPIEVVMFDDHDNYSDTLKQRYLLRCVLQRLYQYQTSNISYMYDHDNPALRLADDYTVHSEYYVGKEKITSEMLSY